MIILTPSSIQGPILRAFVLLFFKLFHKNCAPEQFSIIPERCLFYPIYCCSSRQCEIVHTHFTLSYIDPAVQLSTFNHLSIEKHLQKTKSGSLYGNRLSIHRYILFIPQPEPLQQLLLQLQQLLQLPEPLPQLQPLQLPELPQLLLQLPQQTLPASRQQEM